MNKVLREYFLFILFIAFIGLFDLKAQGESNSGVKSALDKVLPSLVEVHTDRALGSGFYVGNGLIITNKHVIEGANRARIKVYFPYLKQKYNIRQVYTDYYLDFCILEFNNRDANIKDSVSLGNSDEIELGQSVIALGSPLGYSITATFGHISSLFRYHQKFFETDNDEASKYRRVYFMHDAVINHGNSGGPLINYKGDVIGINTATEGEILDNNQFLPANLAFSIPINVIKPSLKRLKNRDSSFIPYIGQINRDIVDSIDQSYLERNNIPPNSVQIEKIVARSPLDVSGIESGDILEAINDQELKGQGIAFLNYMMYTSDFLDTLKFDVFRPRDERKYSKSVVVGRMLSPTRFNRLVVMNPYIDRGAKITHIGTSSRKAEMKRITSETEYKSELRILTYLNKENDIWIIREGKDHSSPLVPLE